MKIKKIRNKKLGFTLVELIIVILIVIVLSSISGPIYRKYLVNTKVSEGYLLLSTIRKAQFAYYDEWGTFLRGYESCVKSYGGETCNETVLNIDARGNKYFTKFSVNIPEKDCKYYFKATAISKDLGNLTMIYDVTSGATIK